MFFLKGLFQNFHCMGSRPLEGDWDEEPSGGGEPWEDARPSEGWVVGQRLETGNGGKADEEP